MIIYLKEIQLGVFLNNSVKEILNRNDVYGALHLNFVSWRICLLNQIAAIKMNNLTIFLLSITASFEFLQDWGLIKETIKYFSNWNNFVLFFSFLLLYKKDATKRRETYESIYDSFVTIAAA